MAGSESVAIELWPDGAPYATGTSEEDCPALIPYLLEQPRGSAGRGAVIVFPGGGYGCRAEHEGEPIARWLNDIGVSAFVLRYRVAPYRYPCALLDAQRAIRHVRTHAEQWGIDPRKIGILGFSAGGHLASSAGTHFDAGDALAADPVERQASRPDAMILCYPVITMIAPYFHEGSRNNLFGPDAPAELVEQFCNERKVTPETPPTFLWHTSTDVAVPVENSLLFAAALSRSKVPFDLHVYDHGAHGVGLALEDAHLSTWTTVAEQWLKQQNYHAE
ncbi:alpha/beta hydrolase [Paenibacillaceae bacterium]|nr:alpha/beta hydrolase [Paenibacillaceae bacterium]